MKILVLSFISNKLGLRTSNIRKFKDNINNTLCKGIKKDFIFYTDDKKLYNIIKPSNKSRLIKLDYYTEDDIEIKKYNNSNILYDDASDYDYIFVIDITLIIKKAINTSLLADFLISKSNIYKNKSNLNYPYCRNNKSSAYIQKKHGEAYYSDMFYGCNNTTFKKYISFMNKCYFDDLSSKILLTSDELYLNKFLFINKPLSILEYESYFDNIKVKNLIDINTKLNEINPEEPKKIEKIHPSMYKSRQNKSFKTEVNNSEYKEYLKKVKKNSNKIKDPIETRQKKIRNNHVVDFDEYRNFKYQNYDMSDNVDIYIEDIYGDEMGSDNRIQMLDVTFIIPVKIDSKEREENLYLCLDYLNKNLNTNIILMEEDKKRQIRTVPNGCRYIYFKQKQNFFYRTKMINDMCKMSSSKYVCNYDCDIFLPIEAYSESINLLRDDLYDVVYPFNGENINVDRFHYTELRNKLDISKCNLTRIRRTSNRKGYGCCVMFDKDKFIEAGMENENFKSWGPEDQERYERFKKMGLRIGRTLNKSYHLKHPKTIDSSQRNPHFNNNVKEFNKIKGMNSERLKQYVSTWGWIWK